MTDIQQTLNERGEKYGKFPDHAYITQALKSVMRDNGWEKLKDSQKEALEMIAHKIGRILNGDPNYADSWVDIASYAQLVVNELSSTVILEAPKPENPFELRWSDGTVTKLNPYVPPSGCEEAWKQPPGRQGHSVSPFADFADTFAKEEQPPGRQKHSVGSADDAWNIIPPGPHPGGIIPKNGKENESENF